MATDWETLKALYRECLKQDGLFNKKKIPAFYDRLHLALKAASPSAAESDGTTANPSTTEEKAVQS